MNAQVQVDNSSIVINASNQLEANTGFVWVITTSTNFTPARNTGYILTGTGGKVNVNLPALVNIGYNFEIIDQSGHLFTVVQNSGDQMQLQSLKTTVGVAGYVTSQTVGDSIQCICSSSGPPGYWLARAPTSNLTVV